MGTVVELYYIRDTCTNRPALHALPPNRHIIRKEYSYRYMYIDVDICTYHELAGP